MTAHAPTSRRVGDAWLRLALPGVGVGPDLPKATDTDAQTSGFARTVVIGGNPDIDVPRRVPVLAAECWLAPRGPNNSGANWGRAEDLGELIVAATFDPALMGVVVDLSSVGSYAPARVHTVVALGEPQRVENDPSGWARVDVDLLITWTVETGA